MSRTGLDAAALAGALRPLAGDGGIEWVTKPMQTSVLLDVADMLDDNAKLRELVTDMWSGMCGYGHDCRYCEHYELYEGQRFVGKCEYHRRMRELGVEVDG